MLLVNDLSPNPFARRAFERCEAASRVRGRLKFRPCHHSLSPWSGLTRPPRFETSALPEQLVGRVKPDHGERGWLQRFIFLFSVDTFLFQVYVPVLFYAGRTTMDWDLAIKRNSEALIEIVADLFAMLGLVADRYGFAAAVAHLSRRAACFAARRNPPCAASSSLRRGALC